MRLQLILCISWIFCGLTTYAQNLPKHEGVYSNGTVVENPNREIIEIGQIYGSHDEINIDIESNFKRLFAYKNDPDYQKGTLGFWMNDSLFVAKKSRIKIRGGSRTKICEYPPIRIDVKKTKFNPSWTKELQSTKIVLPCKEGSRYDQFLAKEYLAYRIYNLLTDFSFKVRMVQLNLIDTHDTHDLATNAFFIERDKLVEKRLGLKEAKYEDLSPATLSKKLYLEPDSTTTKPFSVLSLFQFMIGNTDWAANNYHNIKIFKKGEKIFAVPYDFDYSGLVNADYARSSTSLPINEVTERHYLGPCSTPARFAETAGLFLKKQKQIFALIEKDGYLSKRSKKDVTEYINSFYTLLLDTTKRDSIRRTNCQVLGN